MTIPPPLPCHRCQSAIEPGDLRCPVCYQAVPAAARESSTTVRLQILRCAGCGAGMTYSAAVQALECAFCGGVLKLEEQLDPEEQTDKRLPFTADRAQAIETFRQWIARQGFFRPSNLPSAARLESLRALWWPGWVVNANALVTWTADSDAGAQKAKWAPHAGEFQSQFAGLVIPATRGLSAAECARLIPTYDLESGVTQPAETVQDVFHERFEMPRSFARARILEEIQRFTELRIKQHQIPGSRFRNFHSASHLRGLVTRRLAFPAYLFAYQYRGRLYRTVISGQDPACVIGEAPRSIAKLILVVLAALLMFGFLIALLQLAR